LSLIGTLKTQLAIRFREKILIITLKTILAITCHSFVCVGGEWQVAQINPLMIDN
jgi:hypothetical protein